MISKEMIEAAAEAQEDEWERWIFRRKLDKSGYEAVRLIGDPNLLSNDNMAVTDLGRDPVEAERTFEQMRRHAVAESALTGALSVQWRGMDDPALEQIKKCGTSILLWSEMWECATPILLGWWSDYVNAGQGGWVTENIGIYKWPAEDQPTRWQPLPQPQLRNDEVR